MAAQRDLGAGPVTIAEIKRERCAKPDATDLRLEANCPSGEVHLFAVEPSGAGSVANVTDPPNHGALLARNRYGS